MANGLGMILLMRFRLHLHSCFRITNVIHKRNPAARHGRSGFVDLPEVEHGATGEDSQECFVCTA